MKPRDLIAEQRKLAAGKSVSVRVAQLTDLEMHLIRKAKPNR